MAEPQSKAHDLMDALGLVIVGRGPNGRYPRGEPGPAQGFRYWATYTEGQFKFGIQASPKRTLPAELIARLKRLGFAATPKDTEAFVWLGATLAGAVDGARATMKALAKAM